MGHSKLKVDKTFCFIDYEYIKFIKCVPVCLPFKIEVLCTRIRKEVSSKSLTQSLINNDNIKWQTVDTKGIKITKSKKEKEETIQN